MYSCPLKPLETFLDLSRQVENYSTVLLQWYNSGRCLRHYGILRH